MTTPCSLGMRCPYLCHGEDWEPLCGYPYILTAATPEEIEAAGEPVMCPLIDTGTDMFTLMSMGNEYDAWEWRELVRRLSVHLDRNPDGFREMIRERATTAAWKAYIESLGAME